jgi:hypothetical protein
VLLFLLDFKAFTRSLCGSIETRETGYLKINIISIIMMCNMSYIFLGQHFEDIAREVKTTGTSETGAETIERGETFQSKLWERGKIVSVTIKIHPGKVRAKWAD